MVKQLWSTASERIHCSSELLPFDPRAFRLRLERAKAVRRTYEFTRLVACPAGEMFFVRGGQAPYHVFVDLSGRDAHACTCPDGVRQVAISPAHAGVSLCKHVLARLLDTERCHLLTSYLLLLAKAGPERSYFIHFALRSLP